ncbi:N-6 DNA methylase [Patescibacteria group bacterium]|nr:N-6 DNA methylase [Patescibacteria group bacterium]
MATRQRDIFTTIHTEGAILPPDLLQRIAEGGDGLPGLRAEDYHRPGEKLNEVINRAWNVLLGAWANFQTAQAQLPADDIGTTLTRERWLLPMFRELDYGRLPTERAVEMDGKSYPISHRDAEGNVPIHLISYKVDLDRRTPGVAGAATTSPHSMVQVFLNRSDDVLWGFLSNGLRLRILRDNVSLTRQAYVEFDLEAMMNGEVYADFVLLWLLCHSSRVEGERPEQFWLEQWMQTAVEQGTRALDQLRDNVQVAIERLGAGFLAHPHNMDLRDKLQDGRLDQQDYYRQLLRLVYRLLFLFVAEHRGLLLDPAAGDIARARYIEYYSTRRLRDLAERLRGTRHHDLYHGLRLVMRLLGAERNGEGRALGLPVLGSYLFSDAAVIDIIDCEIGNRDLLDAIRALAFTEDLAVRRLRPIDYQHLGPEELGSVYESLLELHPEIYINASRVTDRFKLTTASGHERKTTGSYYTPSSLIQALLDSALDPVLAEARAGGEAAILDLKICDPACGSGHFLIAASHRIAKALAAVRTQEDEPAPAAVRSALRDVIGHCIYGVDINPMAVELCKVGLWMEALEPGKPLSFLDHRIQCGNSLLGTTPALMANGIPDDAFQPIEGDDKNVVSGLRKQNREERKQREARVMQHGLWDAQPVTDYGALAAEVEALDALDDATLAGVRAKEDRYRALADDPDYIAARLLADAWCAAFVWDKSGGATFPLTFPVTFAATPMTDRFYRRLERHPHAPEMAETRAVVAALAERYQFFHWHVAFPDVFHVSEQEDTENATGWDGGFDVVLGNPPWERIKIQEKEWFAERSPEIAGAPNAAARRKLIAELSDTDPALLAAFNADKRKAEGESQFVRVSERYPLCGRGDVNTYTIFAETARHIISGIGRVGIIVPSGIATEDTTKFFFQDLMRSQALVSLYDFENRDAIFPSIHRSYKFCLLTMTGPDRPAHGGTEFVFFALNVAHLAEKWRRFQLSADEISLLNPNTRNCPTFRSAKDADLAKSMYRLVPVLVDESLQDNPWGVTYSQGIFHSSGDAELFAVNTRESLEQHGATRNGNTYLLGPQVFLPVYEAKMMHQFNHRWATYETTDFVCDMTDVDRVKPDILAVSRYWVDMVEVQARLTRWKYDWLVAFRDIARSTDERTSIFTILPRAGLTDQFGLLFPEGTSAPKLVASLVSNVNAFVFDFSTRQKVGGTHLKKYMIYQLPIFAPETYTPALLDFIVPRVLELTYTAWDLQPFAQDVGWDGPPFVWDEERRFLMRCELDVLYFHLYGIARDDVDYIMETFPIVKRKDIAATATDDFEGEYITKRVILEMYDQLAALGVHDDADRIVDFETWLSPGPADPAVAHEDIRS